MSWWYYAIHKLHLAKVTAIYLSYPVLSVVLSILLGLEKPYFYQFAGLALTLAGAYYLTRITQKEQEKL